MKQAVEAAVLLLLISLLSGCSNSEAKACEAAELSRDKYNKQAGSMQAEAMPMRKDPTKGFDVYLLDKKAKETYILSLQVITTYKECFTPEQVVEAQQYLDKNK